MSQSQMMHRGKRLLGLSTSVLLLKTNRLESSLVCLPLTVLVSDFKLRLQISEVVYKELFDQIPKSDLVTHLGKFSF